MYEDYEDYEDFLDNPTRLITCRLDNATVPDVTAGGRGGPEQVKCVSPMEPFVLDARRQTVAINGIVSPLFVAITLVTNCLVCVVLLKPTMRTCTIFSLPFSTSNERTL